MYEKNKIIQDTVITEIKIDSSTQISFIQKLQSFFKLNTGSKDSLSDLNGTPISLNSSDSLKVDDSVVLERSIPDTTNQILENDENNI